MSVDAGEYRDHLSAVVQRAGLEVDEIVLPVDREVVLYGLKFHYLDWGMAGRPMVVFLHGGGLNSHTWDLCCLSLRKRYHCIALDQRGHGDSQWSEEADYSLASQRNDILAFLVHLKAERAALVGMSMGAINALAFACSHSERLSALVLVDAGPTTRPKGRARIREFVDSNPSFPSLEAAVQQALSFNPRRDPALLRTSLRHNMRQKPDGTWSWKYDHGRLAARDATEYQKTRDALWNDIPGVQCPALVVRGAESDVFLEEDAARLTSSLLHGQQVTIARAGHTVQGDNPKDLVIALQKFFTSAGIG